MDEHYFTENPVSEIREKSFIQAIRNVSLELAAVSGVFSFETRVDKASELLIRHFSPSGTALLDVGCGYGAIGLYLKAAFPEQQVTMVDINNRAVEYAKKNAQRNKLTVTVLHSNLYSEVQNHRFDDIVSNPPIAAGKKLNIQLIEEAWDRLNTNGALWLVAFHNKGGSTLKDIMKTRFGNVEDVEKSGGMRVYRAVKRG